MNSQLNVVNNELTGLEYELIFIVDYVYDSELYGYLLC